MKKLQLPCLFLPAALLITFSVLILLSGCTTEQAAYAGEKKEGLPHGFGTKTCSYGTLYEGEFDQGQRHGKGIWRHSSGIIYSGQWQQDRYHGRGILTIPGLYTFDGQWEEGSKGGFGIQSWNDGRYYEGQWKEGLIHGEGIMHYPDGSIYQGEWKNGRLHGRGIMHSPEGKIITGNWEYGEFTRIPVESLALSEDELTLNINDSPHQLLAFPLPTDATDHEVTWSSADPEIATIENGFVVPQAPGETVISATAADEEVTVECRVTIKPPPVAVTGVSIDRLFLSLRTSDDPYRLGVIIEPEEATNKAVIWHSENPEIAAVSPTGIVTPFEVGETEISATTVDGGFTDTCRVTVRESLFEN